MELRDAILQRKSIRAFLDKPVSREVLCNVFALATRAISAVNAQPWEIAVVTGDKLKKIAQENELSLLSGAREDWTCPPVTGVYKERARSIGRALFAAMEIAREDRERRIWWEQRGYRFFDAPVGVLLYMDAVLDSAVFNFDMGCLAQNICLAAMEYGLGTCVAYQPVTYQKALREYLDIPQSKTLICGIAMGYPDDSFPANQVISSREALDNTVTWHGF